MNLSSTRDLMVAIIAFAVATCTLPASTLRESGDSIPMARINDGPYLYRHSDSSIITMYICNDTVVIDTASLHGDDFRVPGLCYDSASEYIVPAAGFEIKPARFSNVSRVFAISDIHGEYEYLTAIMQNGGVVDSSLHWSWGNGHLVIVGDILDRGDMVTECLWLLYRLEQEAQLNGGDVHVLLGNHEKMVCSGDNRYIHDKYLKGIAAKTRIDHKDLYGSNMVLGQWLRTKHTVITINDVLYVHAGLLPSYVDSGLTAAMLNDAVRKYLGANSVVRRFDEMARRMYGSTGPLWYRGLWEERPGRYDKATDAEIDRILAFYDVTSMVVGHTNMDSVMSHRDGRVFAIDVLFEDLGSLQALLWQDGSFYRVTGEGKLEKLK